MKTNCIGCWLLLTLVFLSTLACEKDEFKRHNDVIVGTYEVRKQEIYHYYEDYTGIDSIIVDTTFATPINWKLAKKDSTDIQLGPDNFGLVKDDTISDWVFNYKPAQTDHYAGQYYFAKVWFFPEQDSFYMEAFQEFWPVAGVELQSITYTGKRL